MDIVQSVASFVGIFLLMILATLWLRHRGVLTSAHKPVIAGMVTDFVMPALIFSQIASAKAEFAFMQAAGAIAASEVVVGIAAGLIGRWALRLDRPALGAFILASTFGSTSLVGNALLQVVYQNDVAITAMGIVIGQFGVGLPNNTIGLFIGMRFGTANRDESLMRQVRAFLLSPPTLALAAGLAWSLAELPTRGPVVTTVLGALALSGAALPFLSAVVTGLSFQMVTLRGAMPVLAAATILQLAIEPLVTDAIVGALAMPELNRQVTLLLAAMPASPLAVVYAARYGGNAELATLLVVATCLLSALSLPLVALLG